MSASASSSASSSGNLSELLSSIKSFAATATSHRLLSPAEQVELMPAKKRALLIGELDKAGLLTHLQFYWPFWARPDQLPPTDRPWVNWIVQAGRGFGKTRVGVEMVRTWSHDVPITHIIAPTASDIHKVVLEGPAGIYKCTTPAERPYFRTKDSTLVWPNGHKTLLFSAEEPERLRGPQCYKLWCDELPAWKYPEKTWTNAVLGLRLGDNPQAVITTTPRPIKLFKELVKDPGTIVTRGTTAANMKNLSPRFISEVVKKYQGTRLGRQELDGELLEDNPGALWTLGMIDADRVDPAVFWKEIYPTLVRIVVAIDPAVTSNEDSDETGIITAGKDKQSPPHLYYFDDRSCIERPKGWATRAIAAYRQFNADRIVGETNNGGEMVEETIHNVDPNIPFTAVHASRGKITRAEPVSALYEQHRVHHVGSLPQLEDQMCDYDPAIATFSPDRMDAAVWAATELFGGGNGVLEYWDQLISAGKQPENTVRTVHAPTSASMYQSAEEKAAMGLEKISGPSNLIKPAQNTMPRPQTTTCPECKAAVSHFAEGAWHCNVCGAEGRDQWQGRSVTNLMKLGGRP